MSSEQADVAFLNGGVYTVDPTCPKAEAVAVSGSRIAAVGTSTDIRRLMGPRTRVVDLHGRLLLPGFQDAHVHPVLAGFELLRCDLSNSRSAADYLETLATYSRRNDGAVWILGGGWAMEAFPSGLPDAALLDQVAPDKMVFLPNRDHHSAWVNSKTLAVAGIGAHTPDPPDGRIERDAAGRPTGTLHEGAMDLVARLVPPVGPEDLYLALMTAQRHLHALGVTAWQDALVGEAPDVPDAFGTYLSAAEQGELTGRVVGALWWDRRRSEDQVQALAARRHRAEQSRNDGGRFQASAVKIMQDGVCETFTAALLDSYLNSAGQATDKRGMSFIEPDELQLHVTDLDRAGFQVHVHAIGDRAVREALDAFEAARRANGPTDHRHHLAHIQFVHPDDLPRFGALGVTANAQPLWACNDRQQVELTRPFVSAERASWQYPFASLKTLGTRLAFGSDWPVSSPDPLQEMHVAVTRLLPSPLVAPEYLPARDPLLPAEAVALESAVHAFTMGSAWVNHLERETGSIEVGKLADLVVLDRDIFAGSQEEIADARVTLTMVGGDVVHDTQEV